MGDLDIFQWTANVGPKIKIGYSKIKSYIRLLRVKVLTKYTIWLFNVAMKNHNF